MKPTKKILILTGSEGHLSIAQTAYINLKKSGYQAKLCELLIQKSELLYLPFYRYFPSLFKIPYKIGEQQNILKAAKKIAEKLLEKKIKELIKQSQPDLIISTHPFYSPAISKVLDYQKTPIPFINIASDPWSIHPIFFSSSANLNLVYDEKGIKLGLKNKISKERLMAIGWLAKNKFYNKYNLKAIRKSLAFSDKTLTLLICGGSEGTNMILKIMPALLLTKKPLQVIVVCGSNQRLYKTLFSLNKFLKKIPKKNFNNSLTIKLYKFTDNLPQLMSVSDLVIGKAGPNLLFETIACKKPFFAICHISGQEDGNLDIIRKKKLGFVEENPIKAIKMLTKIIDKPAVLIRFNKAIEKERQYNAAAADKLISSVHSLLTRQE